MEDKMISKLARAKSKIIDKECNTQQVEAVFAFTYNLCPICASVLKNSWFKLDTLKCTKCKKEFYL
jgi:hypothetical protein